MTRMFSSASWRRVMPCHRPSRSLTLIITSSPLMMSAVYSLSKMCIVSVVIFRLLPNCSILYCRLSTRLTGLSPPRLA